MTVATRGYYQDRKIGKPCVNSGGKRKYRSKADALISNAFRPLMARAYRCVHCDYWHLTRRPPEP